MKDAKGHGSDPRGAAHQAGTAKATERGTMKALVDQAQAKHVTLMLEPDDMRTGDWHLALIQRDQGAPKGTGRDVMNAVHAAADKAGASVTLQPMNKKLGSYYRDMGYKPTGERTEDGPIMVRKPKA